MWTKEPYEGAISLEMGCQRLGRVGIELAAAETVGAGDEKGDL